MKTKNTFSIQNSFFRVITVVGVMLFIPLVMTIYDGAVEGVGWNWSLSDFIIMGTLLSVFGFMIEWVRHNIRNNNKRIALIVGLVVLLLWIWVELAVGLFTNWGS